MKKMYKPAAFLTFFVLGTVAFSATASAYIDPSAMTYIVQVIAGIIIAGGAAFAFYFKRLARKIKGKKEAASQENYEAPINTETFDNDAEFDDSTLSGDQTNNLNDK